MDGRDGKDFHQYHLQILIEGKIGNLGIIGHRKGDIFFKVSVCFCNVVHLKFI